MRLSRSDASLVSTWWFTVDRQLFAAINILILSGLMLSLAASPSVAMRRGFPAFHFVERHLVFALAGAALVFLVSVLRPAQIRRFSLVLLATSLALMGLVIWVGPVVNGSQRWLTIAGQQLQPSELMKPAFVVIASFLFAESMKRRDVPALAIAIALFGLVVSLLWLQPDIGQVILLSAVFAALFFLSGQPVWRLALLAGLGSLAIVVAYGTLPHVKSRFDRFLDPQTGDTYQMDRARQSFIEGGWLGRGPGEGTIKSVLPDAHTDYILAVIAEEYGVIACLVLLGLYGFVVFRALVHFWSEPDGFVRSAIVGLAMLLGCQALINMGVNVGLLPAKGMTLPFISYGGSSLVGMALAMGMLVALTRRRPAHGQLKNTTSLGSPEPAQRGRQTAGQGT